MDSSLRTHPQTLIQTDVDGIYDSQIALPHDLRWETATLIDPTRHQDWQNLYRSVCEIRANLNLYKKPDSSPAAEATTEEWFTAKPAKQLATETQEAPVEPHRRGWLLNLYVAGSTPKSLIAVANLERICKDYLVGPYRIEVIDLLTDPQRAEDDHIIAIPTLVRRFPKPVRKVIGDLSDMKKVLDGLQM